MLLHKSNPFPFRFSLLSTLIIATGLFTTLSSSAQPPRPGPALTREGLVQRQRYAEGLIKSAEADFEVVMSPTKPDMVPLIRDICRLRGVEGEVANYTVNESFAQAQSYKARWWRKGEKERLETYRLDQQGGEPKATTTFDGQFVRSLASSDNSLTGSVDTVDGAHWYTSERIHPLALIHTYCGTPYSTIIQQGSSFSIVPDGLQRGYTKVTVQHPKLDFVRFSLLLDSEWRLKERRLICKIGSDTAFRVYEVHEFDDYRMVDNPAGDSVLMPMSVTQRYVVGEHSSGKLAEYWQIKVRVTRIAINTDLPDDRFELAIPRKAKVWDGVTGQGWLIDGERPELLFPEDTKGRRRWWMVAGACALALLVLLGGFRYAKRRRGQAAVRKTDPQNPRS